jgi:hypothetical protein
VPPFFLFKWFLRVNGFMSKLLGIILCLITTASFKNKRLTSSKELSFMSNNGCLSSRKKPPIVPCRKRSMHWYLNCIKGSHLPHSNLTRPSLFRLKPSVLLCSNWCRSIGDKMIQ